MKNVKYIFLIALIIFFHYFLFPKISFAVDCSKIPGGGGNGCDVCYFTGGSYSHPGCYAYQFGTMTCYDAAYPNRNITYTDTDSVSEYGLDHGSPNGCYHYEWNGDGPQCSQRNEIFDNADDAGTFATCAGNNNFPKTLGNPPVSPTPDPVEPGTIKVNSNRTVNTMTLTISGAGHIAGASSNCTSNCTSNTWNVRISSGDTYQTHISTVSGYNITYQICYNPTSSGCSRSDFGTGSAPLVYANYINNGTTNKVNVNYTYTPAGTTPSPPPPSPTVAVLKGGLDTGAGPACVTQLNGWDCDQYDYSKPLQTRLYQNVGGTLTGLGSITSDGAREQAVATACGGDNRFNQTEGADSGDGTPPPVQGCTASWNSCTSMVAHTDDGRSVIGVEASNPNPNTLVVDPNEAVHFQGRIPTDCQSEVRARRMEVSCMPTVARTPASNLNNTIKFALTL